MTAPHTGPSEEQVRERVTEWLKGVVRGHNPYMSGPRVPHEAQMAIHALALLDAGRKDRERVDWLEHQAEYGRVTLDTNNPEFDNSEPKYTVYASAKGGRKFGETLRAAIDRARGA